MAVGPDSTSQRAASDHGLGNRRRVAAILLAAGTSTRFGGHQPKQLFEVDGEPLVVRICRQALVAPVDVVVCIVGNEATEISRVVGSLGIRTVLNPDFAAGQSTSIRAGLRAIPGDVEGALFVPIDQPWLDAATLSALVAAFHAQERPANSIVVPTFDGRRGAPVLFGSRFFGELRTLREDSGGRGLVTIHGDSVVEVELHSDRPLLDIDTADDVATLLGPREAPAARPLRMINPLQHYEWGSRYAMAELRGDQAPTRQPEAELWMGAHARSSSVLLLGEQDGVGVEEPLTDFVARHPLDVLGDPARKRFGDELPFLFKILAARRPLSLQLHPPLAAARQGFEREEADRLAAEQRLFPDPNAKSELVLALGRFELLAGWRDPEEIAADLGRLDVDELSPLREALEQKDPELALRSFLGRLLEGRDEDAAGWAYLAALHAAEHPDRPAMRWLRRLQHEHPQDPAVLAPLFLHHLTLEPGQALFTPPGVLHSYLGGLGLEVMRSSDNVLRAGLTGKQIAIQEVLATASCRPRAPRLLQPQALFDGGRRFVGEDSDFALWLYDLEPSAPILHEVCAVAILLCVSGSVNARQPHTGALSLAPGQSLLVPAASRELEISGEGTVAIASVPV